MDPQLFISLQKSGVRDEIIEILKVEEFDTVDVLTKTSDDLLKLFNIKGGQISKIRTALTACTNDMIEDLQYGTSRSFSLHIFPPVTPLSNNKWLSQTTPPVKSRPTSPLPKPRSPSPVIPSTCSTSLSAASPSSSALSDMTVPLPSSDSFAMRENVTGTKHWVRDFKLPELFPPCVMEGLKSKTLSGNARNEFSRIVWAAVRVHTLYPTPSEKVRVVSMVLTKYPFLGDNLGAGHNSWLQAMTDWFKNQRRKRKVTEAVKPKKRASAECTPPVLKKKKVYPDSPQMPEGETKETCQEHVKCLQREMAKVTGRNKRRIEILMSLTFAYRRQNLLAEPQRVGNLLENYPALQLQSELKAEFERIIGDKHVVKNGSKIIRSLEGKILDVASKSAIKKMEPLLVEMREEVGQEPAEKNTAIESSTAALALQLLLKDKSLEDDLFFKICSECENMDELVKSTRYPRLIGCGTLSKLNSLLIAAEGKVVCTLGSVPLSSAITLLLGTFYILNMEYTPGARNIYAFLEAVILNNSRLAKKRISVQKLIKELGLQL